MPRRGTNKVRTIGPEGDDRHDRACLQRIQMTHLIVGDIHGCGREFRSFMEKVSARPEYDDARIILVGDLFSKGPNPELVTKEILIQRRNGRRIDLICGNHELRLLGAIGRIHGGVPLDAIGKHERNTIKRLDKGGVLAKTIPLLLEATRRIQHRILLPAGPATVVHAGIEPTLGLDGTPDHLKTHIKSAPGEINWWERYDGRDGLVIFGHKPVPEPVIMRDDEDRPIAVNIDTGCIYGGHLSGYHVESGTLLQVRSEQPIDMKKLAFALSPTLAPIGRRSASDAPARMPAG